MRVLGRHCARSSQAIAITLPQHHCPLRSGLSPVSQDSKVSQLTPCQSNCMTWLIIGLLILFVAYSFAGSSGGPTNPNTRESLEFDTVPDGKYLVRSVDEAAIRGNCAVAILQIAAGDHKAIRIPMIFSSAKAKTIICEYSGDYVARLDFEGDGRAGKLDSAMRYAESDTDGVFIVNYKDGKVTSMPKFNADKVNVWLRNYMPNNARK